MTNEHAKLLEQRATATYNLNVAIHAYFETKEEDRPEAWANLSRLAEIVVDTQAAIDALPQIWDRAYWANLEEQ